jgi:NDP-sugar pyrophosphorylase family protein
MKAVIFASGIGTRLQCLTRDLPKPLVPVLGRCLVEYTIDAFVQAGFERLGVVMGYMGHMLPRHLGNGHRFGIRIDYLSNPDYRRGNATSIHACRQYVKDEPFVAAVADHMISGEILETLLACSCRSHTLCIDLHLDPPWRLIGATKVWVDKHDFVTHIGKDLVRFNALDTGVFLLGPRIFQHVSVGLRQGLGSITSVLQRMIARGDPLHACDVSGSFWLDVDTPEDLRYASGLSRSDAFVPGEE